MHEPQGGPDSHNYPHQRGVSQTTARHLFYPDKPFEKIKRSLNFILSLSLFPNKNIYHWDI